MFPDEFIKDGCLSAPLAITAHFWLLGKVPAQRRILYPMKFRSIALCLLPVCSVLSPSLPAQDQAPAPSAAAPVMGDVSATPSAPLQIQENPAPLPVPETPATPAPEGQTAPAVPASPDPMAPMGDAGMGSPGQNPPPSDPNSLIPPPSEPEQPSPVNAAGNEEKQRQEQKARYYSVKVKADKEEALASLMEKSDKAKNDESRRQALRQYYDLLAKRMKKLDPSLSDWIDTMHSAYLRRLEQVRIEPTVPVNPPPTADASPSPSPTAKKKKKVSSPD